MDLNRWTPFQFPNGRMAKNRVVVPPMASQTADEQGYVTEKTLRHYENLSRSGAGIVFVEYSYVHVSGKGEPHQLGVDSDDKIEGLKNLARTIKSDGALAGLQIVHAGGKASTEITGQPLLGASSIPVPVKGWEPEVPREITLEEIRTLTSWYVHSAERAHLAGFDFIELHAAHGYGLNQWLSPITNQRRDLYGGPLENRARLLTEILKEIRAQFSRLMISVRIPAQDHLVGGLQIEDMQKVVKLLEQNGVSLINVSSGIGGWRRPEGRSGEGYLVEDASQIKLSTYLPVIGVGGIEKGPTIDQMLQAKKLDFAAVGRAILQDPNQWNQMNLR